MKGIFLVTNAINVRTGPNAVQSSMSPGYKEGDAGMWDAKIGINGEALSGGSREEVRQPKSTAMID